MSNDKQTGYSLKLKSSLTALFTYTAIVAIIWTLTISGFLIWIIYKEQSNVRNLAKKEALASFNKDQAFRFWATSHGGVYVPTDGRTPPNPYLSHIPDRDIET